MSSFHPENPHVMYVQGRIMFMIPIGGIRIPGFIIIDRTVRQTRGFAVNPYCLFGRGSELGESGGTFLLTRRNFGTPFFNRNA